jgi:tetratricopeptide (TPR) repeat protein
VFDTGFAQIFRAVDRIRTQLETADSAFKKVLAEELFCLRRLGDQYIDHWMALDEQIGELIETYGLTSENDGSSPDGPEVSSGIQGVLPVSRTARPFAAAKNQTSRTDQASEWQLPAPIPTSQQFAEYFFDQSYPVAVNFRKGIGYFDLFMFDDAVRLFSSVVQGMPHPVAKLYLAAALAARGEYEAALVHLRSVKDETHDPLLLCSASEMEAIARLGTKDVAGATQCYLDISLMMPDYQDVWFNLGVCHAMQKDFAAAEQAFTQALADAPDDAEAGYLLAVVQIFRKRYSAAESTCRLMKSRFPDDIRFLRAHVHIQAGLGHYREAILTCRNILKTSPQDTQTASLLAWLLIRQGQVHQAVTVLKEQSLLDRENRELQAQLGIVEMLLGDYKKAEELLLNSLDGHTEPTYVWLALGQISLKTGNRAQAISRFLRVLKDKRRPMKRLALYYYGLTLFEEARYAEAEKYFKAATLLGDTNPALWVMLGRTAERLGRSYEAEKLYSRAKDAF